MRVVARTAPPTMCVMGESSSFSSRIVRRGFTLMEMLVVISIITLLISIMLPALGKSKENARRAVCMANLHSQVQAGTSYSVNNRDYFPPSQDANGGRWAYTVPGAARSELSSSTLMRRPRA